MENGQLKVATIKNLKQCHFHWNLQEVHVKKQWLERLRFTFMPKGKRELVPRKQVLPLIVVNYLLLQIKNK